MARGRFTYKYICEECEEPTFFSRQERISAAGMRCGSCGSRYLNPSKRLNANHNIPLMHNFKLDYDARKEELQAGMEGSDD